MTLDQITDEFISSARVYHGQCTSRCTVFVSADAGLLSAEPLLTPLMLLAGWAECETTQFSNYHTIIRYSTQEAN